MIAAGLIVDLGRASKLAPGQDRDIIGQAALVQVVHQRRDRLIKDGQLLLGLLEVVAMPIPEAVIDGHHADAGFDQAASDQEILRRSRGAVAEGPIQVRFTITLTHLGGLLADVQGVEQLR